MCGCDSMLVSMTGYGQASLENEGYRINIEIRSVNHRFSEINVRIPRQFLLIEERLKKAVNEYVQRGKVDVFVTVEGEGLVTRKLEVDWSLVDDYFSIYKQAQQKLNIEQQLSLEKLLLHPDIVTIYEKEASTASVIEDIVQTAKVAANKLLKMRQSEGQVLANDLKARLNTLATVTNDIANHAPTVVSQYETRLLKRVLEFVNGKLEIDESRIMTEVAIFADKASIDEEITRLISHIEQFHTIIDATDRVVGRKLDFLVQEMNREANTIGSKSNDLHINKQVVELKAELEKIKEQVQNIE